MKILFLFLFLLISINLVSAAVGTDDFTQGKVVYIDLDFINYTLVPTVNSSEWWDSLDFPNATQMEEVNNELTIKESWLISFGDILWNWTASLPYFDYDGNNLDFNETHLNLTIDDKLASITYNATEINTYFGTLDSGNLASILNADDGDSYNVSEAGGGAPVLTIIINFTNVTDFNQILMREWYDGSSGHELAIGLYDFPDGDFEEEYGEITDQTGFQFSKRDVFDASAHIDSTGNVSLRIDHLQSGINTHNFFLDYIVLIDGFSTITNTEHNSMSGRDDPSNHPWAVEYADFSRGINGSGTINTTGTVGITHDEIGLRIDNPNLNGADTGLKIVGARDGQTIATDNLNSYIDFSDYDSNQAGGTEFIQARIGGGMHDASGTTGYFGIKIGTGLVTALTIDKNLDFDFQAGDLTTTGTADLLGECQFGNANTENHGINTAPVAGTGLTLDSYSNVGGDLIGLNVTADYAVSAPGTQNVYGGKFSATFSGGATTANIYGLNVTATDTGGSANENTYGLWVSASGGDTNNYGIWVDAGNVVISDSQKGSDVSLTIWNKAINGNTNESVSIIAKTDSSPDDMGNITFGKVLNYVGSDQSSFMEFSTAKALLGVALGDTLALRIDDNQNLHLPSNTTKLYFGVDDEASITWDTANFVFDYNSTNASANAWFSGNLSAINYNTRTSVFDKLRGNALDYIQDADYYKDDGEINHSKFYGYTTYDVIDYSNPLVEKVCRESDNITYCGNMTSYPYKTTEEAVSLNLEIDVLRQAVYEQQLLINNLTARIEELEK